MATYTLSGSGVQALSANVTALHVTIATLPTAPGNGTANPTNYYSVALLRPGDAVGFFDAVPVVGGPQWLALPNGTTRLGYSCVDVATLTVAEVIGGTPPFGGGGALAGLSDVALASPVSGQVLTYVAPPGDWQNVTPTGGGGGGSALPVVLAVEQQPSGTNGGTSAAGTWQTRTLNTLVLNDGSVASLASNTLTLAAGTYRCNVHCPALGSDRHQARLWNATSSTVLLVGTSEFVYSTGSNGYQTRSFVVGRFVLTASSGVQVQHRMLVGLATYGFGVGSNFGMTETYTVAEFVKEA